MGSYPWSTANVGPKVVENVVRWRASVGSKYELVLKGGARLPVGRTRYKTLINGFNPHDSTGSRFR